MFVTVLLRRFILRAYISRIPNTKSQTDWFGLRHTLLYRIHSGRGVWLSPMTNPLVARMSMKDWLGNRTSQTLVRALETRLTNIERRTTLLLVKTVGRAVFTGRGLASPRNLADGTQYHLPSIWSTSVRTIEESLFECVRRIEIRANLSCELPISLQVLEGVVDDILIDYVAVRMCKHVPESRSLSHRSARLLNQNADIPESPHRGWIALRRRPSLISNEDRPNIKCCLSHLDEPSFDDVLRIGVLFVCLTGEGPFLCKHTQTSLDRLDCNDNSGEFLLGKTATHSGYSAESHP